MHHTRSVTGWVLPRRQFLGCSLPVYNMRFCVFLFIVFSLVAVEGLHKILPFWWPESAKLDKNIYIYIFRASNSGLWLIYHSLEKKNAEKACKKGEIREFACMQEWSENRSKEKIVVRPVMPIRKTVGFMFLATVPVSHGTFSVTFWLGSLCRSRQGVCQAKHTSLVVHWVWRIIMAALGDGTRLAPVILIMAFSKLILLSVQMCVKFRGWEDCSSRWREKLPVRHYIHYCDALWLTCGAGSTEGKLLQTLAQENRCHNISGCADKCNCCHQWSCPSLNKCVLRGLE